MSIPSKGEVEILLVPSTTETMILISLSLMGFLTCYLGYNNEMLLSLLRSWDIERITQSVKEVNIEALTISPFCLFSDIFIV